MTEREPLASLTTLLAALRRHPLPALCPAPHLDALDTVPDCFGASVMWALAECRLAGPARSDLAVLFSDGQSRSRLREAIISNPSAWPAHWRSAGLALAAWLMPGHPVSEARQLSLEWDCAPSPAEPFPFLTFELAPGEPTSPERALRLAAALSEAVDRRPLSPRDVEVVERLPASGSTLHFGSMGERGHFAHRWVSGLEAVHVERFVRELGWRGDAAALGDFACTMSRGAPHVSVHLDVAEALGARVGLELFFPGAPSDDVRWSPVLTFLQARGLATAERLAEVSTWPGAGDGLVRLLDLKVVFDERGPCEAKAYLAFCPENPGA